MKQQIFALICGYLMVISLMPTTGGVIDDTSISDQQLNSVIDFSDEVKDVYEDHATISSSNPDQTIDGYTLINSFYQNKSSGVRLGSYSVMYDMDGNVVGGTSDYQLKFINSTTLLGASGTDVHFWNMETNTTKIVEIPARQHHDIEYNTIDDTLIVLGSNIYEQFNGRDVIYDDIYEVDMDGNVLFNWTSYQNLPVDVTNDTVIFRGNYDPIHGNSIFFDYETNLIYLNAKHTDTFYAINRTSAEVEWSVGRLGSLTSYALNGSEVSTNFYNAHAVEKISDDRFILFDNDDKNLTRNSDIGVSRLVELEIDVAGGSAREVWNWTPEGTEYFSRAWGDADRLPNGNTLGTFGNGLTDFVEGIKNPARITEVNPEGDIVWELQLNNSAAYNYDYEFSAYRADRFYDAPLIQFNEPTGSDFTAGDNVNYVVSTWNTIRNSWAVGGELQVDLNGERVADQAFEFNKYWQETQLAFSYTVPDRAENLLEITIINEDGKSKTIQWSFTADTTSTEDTPFFLVSLSIFALTTFILVRRSKQ